MLTILFRNAGLQLVYNLHVISTVWWSSCVKYFANGGHTIQCMTIQNHNNKTVTLLLLCYYTTRCIQCRKVTGKNIYYLLIVANRSEYVST